MKNNKKAGFTLAEILVTLMVIGVVAAMTLPMLITNVKDRAFASAKENTFLKIQAATNGMKTQGTLDGYTSNSAFVTEFERYMTVIKTCDSSNLDNCFAPEFKSSDGVAVDTSTLTTGNKLGKNNLTDGTIAMLLKNGTSVLFSLKDSTKAVNDCKYINPYDNTSNTTSCMSFLYDINGFGPPNVLGRDIGTVNVTGLVCSGIKTADGTCFAGAFTPTPMSLADCNANKGLLGINTCAYDPDSWAGAVAQCGGVSNIPSVSKLAQLANEIYGVDNCDPSGFAICNGTFNSSKSASVGLPAVAGFHVWATENSSPTAYYRYFNATASAKQGNGERNVNTRYAICLE